MCKQQNSQLQERTIGRVRENGKKWWFVQEIECNSDLARMREKDRNTVVHRRMCVCMCVCVWVHHILTPYLFSRSPRWILWNAARITHHRQPWIAEAFFKGVFIFKVRPAAGVCSAHLRVRVSGWICGLRMLIHVSGGVSLCVRALVKEGTVTVFVYSLLHAGLGI